MKVGYRPFPPKILASEFEPMLAAIDDDHFEIIFSSFQTFLGQKYGYRPFPPKILASEFELMLAVIDADHDKNLLTKWFKRDDNLVPANYILQSISSLLPHFNNHSSSAEEISKASNEWWTAFERMQVVLRSAASKALTDASETRKYYVSGKVRVFHRIMTSFFDIYQYPWTVIAVLLVYIVIKGILIN